METLDQATLRVGNEKRTVPFVPGNALFDAIRRDGYFPSGDEAALAYGGVAYLIQPASAEHRPHRVYRVMPPEWSHVTFVEERPAGDMPYPPRPAAHAEPWLSHSSRGSEQWIATRSLSG